MGRCSDANTRLMDAALDLIWKRSYGSVTIDQICEKAGVKKGSFYYFFESKSDLAVAAFDFDWEKCGKPKWDSLFSAAVPPLERLKALFDFTYEAQAKLKKETGSIPGCPCFSIGSEIGTQDDKISAKIQEILQRYIRYFETAIRDAQAEGSLPAGDPPSQARCLYAFFEGSMGQARIQNDLEYLRNLSQNALIMLGAKVATKAA
jgi:TetR/AcrR family transcriptional repressor of nem operon